MAQRQRRPLVAGNWKMNGLKASARRARARSSQGARGAAGKADLLVCPPATLIDGVRRAGARLQRSRSAAQDCHAEPSGAFTGDISAEMLADAGATRRDRRPFRAAQPITARPTRTVRAKALAAWRAGLMAIVCVGETKDERAAGRTLDVGRRAARRLGAGRRDGAEPRRRLRAGLGDRHRADADAGRRRGGAWLHPRNACARGSARPARRSASSMAARSSRRMPAELLARRRRRRRAGRRRQPEGRGFPRDRGGLSVSAVRPQVACERLANRPTAPDVRCTSQGGIARRGSCRDAPRIPI